MKILLVEDDLTISEALTYTLRQDGYAVESVRTVKEALPLISHNPPDLYLLDVSLPDGTGYDICRKIKMYHESPVIFLTARDDEANIVMGLDLGADDYITKPFGVRELLSRIKSVLRRYNAPSKSQFYQYGPISVHSLDAKVFLNGNEVFLTALEYKLLLLLIQNQGQLFTRDQLLDHIFDISGEYVNDNTLTVYIKRLREKLEEDSSNPHLLKTVRGLGYKMGE